MNLKNKTAAAALAAGLALSLAACGSDDTATAGSGGSDTQATAEATPVAELDALNGRDTGVKLDPAFLEGITGLGLTPAPLGTADLTGDSIAFPITGGNATYYDPNSGVTPYVQGEVRHEGSGLSLTGGGKTVELTDFVVDPGESVLTGKVTVDGEVAFESAPLFFLDGRTLNPLQVNEAEGLAVLQGTTVSLTKEAADALNMVFGVDALTEFFPVGVATITLELPKS